MKIIQYNNFPLLPAGLDGHLRDLSYSLDAYVQPSDEDWDVIMYPENYTCAFSRFVMRIDNFDTLMGNTIFDTFIEETVYEEFE